MKRKSIVFWLLLGVGLVVTTLSHLAARPFTTAASSYAALQSTPTLSINDVSLVEGNAGTSNMLFTVTLTASGARPTIGVAYDSADGPPLSGASATSDYTRVSGSLIFPSGTGTSTMTISVPIIGDTTVESDEIFFVNLSRPDGATITDAQGIGSIINDDATPLPTLSISDASLVEGNAGTTFMTFTVTLTATGSWSSVTVFYETTDSMPPSATEGSDYADTDGILSFSPGSGNATRTISVPVTGDTTVELDETFVVSLFFESGATVTRRQGIGTIVNDDSVPTLQTLSINDVSVIEGNSGRIDAVFTVSLSAAGASAVTVDYVTADGTAMTSDNDFAHRSGTLTFPAGDASPKTIAVPIIGDTRNEPDQHFFVALLDEVNATIADGQGVCTIINDDSSSLPELSISGGSMVEGNPDPNAPGSGERALLSLTLSNRSSSDIAVDFATADGTATLADNDYANTSGTLTIPAGHFRADISIPIVPDTRIESDETFFVNLSNPVGAIVRDGQASYTITTDDCGYSISPTSRRIPFQGNTAGDSFVVIPEPDSPYCSWTATSNAPWIHAFYNDLNSVGYVVDLNSGPPRTGTITAGGQTFTVNQDGVCPASSYMIAPTNATADEDGGVGSFAVTAPGDCGWSATTNVSWIILSDQDGLPGVEGRGNGEIVYTVQRNTDDGTSAGPRWGAIIINGVIQHTVEQAAEGCPIRLMCALFPGLCVENGQNALSQTRSFRDKVLAATPRGREYTQLYYKFSTEAVQIMMLNPMLLVRSRGVMERYLPVVQTMVRGEQVTLSQGDLDEINSFLDSFAQKGSPELRESLKSLSDDLRDPQVHQEFNITITEGPLRKLPARGAFETVDQIGMMTAPIGLLLFCIYTVGNRRKNAKRE